jgi:hypothetical protein
MDIQAKVWRPNPECPACASGVAAMDRNDQRQAMVQAEAMKKIRALTAEVEALRGALECLIVGACAVAVPNKHELAVLKDAVDIARAALAAAGRK